MKKKEEEEEEGKRESNEWLLDEKPQSENYNKK